MIDMKRFEKSDWEIFAGAEEFTNGQEPLIGEFEIDGKGYILVACLKCVSIYDDNGSEYCVIRDGEEINTFVQLKAKMTAAEFIALSDLFYFA